MKKILYAAAFLLILPSCSSPGDRLKVDVSEVGVPEVPIRRYDRDLFRVDPDDLRGGLERLKPQYPFFLNTDLGDTMKLLAMKDYLANERNLAFYKACDSAFPDLGKTAEGLTDAFRHVAWYFPEFRIPRVYSYISGGDYQYPVQWADSVMLIALDCYLGKDFPFYKSDQLPLYRMQRTDPAYIIPDAMTALYGGLFPAGFPGNTLLYQIVEAGKRILFIDAMMPEAPARLKLGYTPEQYAWASDNEEHIWAAIISNQLLYSTRGQTMRSFLADGPFTAEFSKDSPPRLGEFIGWKILLQYYEENPSLTLKDLMKEEDAQKVLTLSKYKPRK
jgi:hypothetical protein